MGERNYQRRHAATRRRRDFLTGVSVSNCLLVLAFPAFGRAVPVKKRLRNGDFPLVRQAWAAEIFAADDDFKVVRNAAENFATDFGRVSGGKPAMKPDAGKLSKNVAINGAPRKNPLSERLSAGGNLNVSKPAGKRESGLMETGKNPFPKAERALGKSRIKVEKGVRAPKIFAVETGIVPDQIVFGEGAPPNGYFAPGETFVRQI